MFSAAESTALACAADMPRRSMRFCFEVSPLLKTTDDFASPNSSASVSISSLLAFPSTGAQRIRTFTASPISESIPALDERGCARTLITTPSGVSEKHSILRIAPVGERHERRRFVCGRRYRRLQRLAADCGEVTLKRGKLRLVLVCSDDRTARARELRARAALRARAPLRASARLRACCFGH